MPYQYQEDSKGRLFQLVNPFNQTTTLHYDPDGKNIETDLPNGVKELRGYLEPQDWLSGITIQQQNGAMLDQLTYYYTDSQGSYDPTGHLRRETDGAGRLHEFFYDHRYQLTGETHPDFGTLAYGYDANGNRTSRTLNGTTVDYYGVDANNKLQWLNRGINSAPTSGQASPYMLFHYDADGNTIRRERRYDGGILRQYDLFWDGDDNLRQTNQAGNYGFVAAYNGDGLRVSKSDFWTAPHTYTWGLGGVLYDSSNSTTYTPGVSQNVNGTDSFYDTDWLGSTRYLTSGTGNTATAAPRYDAFGERTNALEAVWASDFQFAGEWGYQTEWAASYEPGTGLQYLQNRYYDPAVGRFISQDPIGFLQGTNLFRYVDDDPVNGIDPLGLQQLPRDPTEASSPGATVKHLVDTRQWQQLREVLADINSTVRSEESFQRILNPLRTDIQAEFDPIFKRYPLSAFRCSEAASAVHGVLETREIPYEIIELNETGAPRFVRPVNLIERIRWWRGPPEYARNGYHAAIRVYGRVYDTVTGTKGLPFAEWLQRLGITARDIYRVTPVMPGTFTQ
jgi:RHS repeat-associated protein